MWVRMYTTYVFRRFSQAIEVMQSDIDAVEREKLSLTKALEESKKAGQGNLLVTGTVDIMLITNTCTYVRR